MRAGVHEFRVRCAASSESLLIYVDIFKWIFILEFVFGVPKLVLWWRYVCCKFAVYKLYAGSSEQNGFQPQFFSNFNHRTLDKDKNGFVDAAELRNIMTTVGEALTEDEVDEMISYMDTNGDGKILYENFIKDGPDEPAD